MIVFIFNKKYNVSAVVDISSMFPLVAVRKDFRRMLCGSKIELIIVQER